MTTSRFKTHDAYIAAQPASMRKHLSAIRTTVRKAVPEAEDSISYGMPAFKLNGRILLYFAAWQEHIAIYPGSATALTSMATVLKPYRASKGTLRFDANKPMPIRLVRAIAKLRAEEVASAKTAKKPAKNKRLPAGTGRKQTTQPK